jgi:hypothetical protein
MGALSLTRRKPCGRSGLHSTPGLASTVLTRRLAPSVVRGLARTVAVQGTVQSVGGKGTAQYWTTGLTVVVSGGFGMPDVHGRPPARDIKAAGNCDHAHGRVLTASDVHFSRVQTIDVLEQVLLVVSQDAVYRPSPPDAGGRCRTRVLTEQPKVKRVYPSTSPVHALTLLRISPLRHKLLQITPLFIGTQRLRRKRLSIPDYTHATSALHGCRPSAAEGTPWLAATSVAERRLLRFSSDSGDPTWGVHIS